MPCYGWCITGIYVTPKIEAMTSDENAQVDRNGVPVDERYNYSDRTSWGQFFAFLLLVVLPLGLILSAVVAAR